MKRTTLSLVSLLAAALLSPGCDFADALEKGAEMAVGQESNPDAPERSEHDKRGEKLQGYIQCINHASSRVHDAIRRYYSWVDFEKGVTGSEKNVYGLYEVKRDDKCLTGIDTSNAAEPKDEELESAATAWKGAYETAQAEIIEAHRYYDQKDYLDDDFAKGKEFHPKLAEAFKAFEQADRALRDAVEVRNDEIQRKNLERMEKEDGRKLRFLTALVMAEAKALLKVGDVPDYPELDLPKFEAAIAKYAAALKELNEYVEAHPKEVGTVTIFSTFHDTAGDMQTAAKELMRRKRDDKAYTDHEKIRMRSGAFAVDGTPAKLSRAYNDLVSRSNALNWHRYQPDA
ncbi:MAG: YiiG family protein [Myxococcota bacterium]